MTDSFHLVHSPLVSGIIGYNLPAATVLVVSIVIGFLMVIIFGYTSDQKAIKHALQRNGSWRHQRVWRASTL